MRKSLGNAVAGLALVSLAAVTTVTVGRAGKEDRRAERIEFSGFMDSYDDLKRVDGFSDFVWGYTKRPLILQDYKAAIIDPVLVYFHPEAAGGVGLDPARLAELTAYFRSSVIEQLEQLRGFEVVEQPAPGVMRVRIAITDLNLSRGGANIGAKAATMAAGGVGFLVPSVDVGGATMECEILDSQSGDRLVALVDTDHGRRMFNFKSLTTLGDAKAAMRGWAKDFRTNLERIYRGELPKKLE